MSKYRNCRNCSGLVQITCQACGEYYEGDAQRIQELEERLETANQWLTESRMVVSRLRDIIDDIRLLIDGPDPDK